MGEICSQQYMTEFIEHFINNVSEISLAKQRHFDKKKDGNMFLVVLDNVEGVLEGDEIEEFYKLMN